MATAQTTSKTVTTVKSSSTASPNIRQLVKPIATARTLVITRSNATPAQNSSTIGATSFSSTAAANHAVGGVTSKVMNNGVGAIKTGRQREKLDLRDLNERLANYIEKVRFLEAQNRKLAGELNTLRERWGKDTEKIKQQYEVEMAQLRNLMNDAEKAKGDLQVRLNALEDELSENHMQLDNALDQNQVDREVIDKLNQQIADYDGEISLLRRRVAGCEEEAKRDKNEINRLRNELKRVRLDLDQETLHHINVENEAQSLKDELEFIKQIHQNELKELAMLAYRDTTQENREFWKNEMSQALRDVQNEYDDKLESMRSEIESYYNVKLQEYRTSGTRSNGELIHVKEDNLRMKSLLQDLRNRVPDLEAKNAQLERLLQELKREAEERARDFELEKNGLQKDLAQHQTELESVLNEMQLLLDAKLSLELEIAAYRKLLEGEETRLGLREMMTHMMRTEPPAELQVSANATKVQKNTVTKGEMSAKTTYQRTAKGNVTIQDCSPDGKFLTLENTGKKREDISNMKLIRNVENGRQIIRYTIPDKTFLEIDGRGKSVKIWAHGNRPVNSTDLEMTSEQSWGVGANIVTTLQATDGEERATHTQRTVYNQ